MYGLKLREWIESIDRGNQWFILAIARINFVLRASNTVRPSLGVTKKDTIWPLSRDLNFCRIDLGLGRTLFPNTNLTDRSIKTGGYFRFFGPLSEKLPTVPIQSRKNSNHVHTRVTCKLNSRPPGAAKRDARLRGALLMNIYLPYIIYRPWNSE